MTSRRQKNFSINSRDRVSGTGTNFDVVINMPDNNKFNRMSLTSYSIPKDYYMITGTDNTFLTQVNGGGYVSTTIENDRNYSASQLATAIQATLVAQNSTFLCTFDTNTGFFTIRCDLGFDLDLSSNALLGRYLGMEASILSGVLDTGKYYLYSTKIAHLQRHDELHIRTSISTDYDKPILYRLYPSDTESFAQVVGSTDDYEGCAVILSNNNTQDVRVSLTNRDGEVVDLNGGDWSFNFTCFTERLE